MKLIQNIKDLAADLLDNGHFSAAYALLAFVPDLEAGHALEASGINTCKMRIESVVAKALPLQTDPVAASALRYEAYSDSLPEMLERLRVAIEGLGATETLFRGLCTAIKGEIIDYWSRYPLIGREVLNMRNNLLIAVKYQANDEVRRWLEAGISFQHKAFTASGDTLFN